MIERSKNANVVVYDARRTAAGEFAAGEPVDAYWLMNAERGQREELNFLERRLAYGLDVSPGPAPDTFVVRPRAVRSRRLVLGAVQGCVIATTTIAGREAVLERVFVETALAGTRVLSVTLFGSDRATGAPLEERIGPGR